MSQGNLPEGFSLKFGSNPPTESRTDYFLKTATSPTFPFIHIKLKKNDSKNDADLEAAVSPKLYELIKSTLFTDELLLYTTGGSQFGNWAFDMIIGMKILNNLKLFESFGTWILQSRECLSTLLENKKFEAEFNLESAKKNSEEFLKSLEIFDEVNKQELIFTAAQEALKEKSMDSSTLIYRLAMALYHSKRGSDSSLIGAIDDPSETYLSFIKTKLFEKHKGDFAEMMDLPLDLRVAIMKVLISFIIAVYAYYKVVE
ncbi:MAG: hypothetical protein K5798_03440 [Nitrosopumilus sp.]|uniref:hypothetical protein n=1 Tax=Nitrosopumilus sp. TaxID=2024843 RepID=UPI00242F953B|nr:hypothetical protein [Nitrosopumilus sp.]MCV0366305.1 hypothetical protein [Nitrosopumilus sp.]